MAANQTKGVISLTFATVVLLSGVWAAYLAPGSENFTSSDVVRTSIIIGPTVTETYSFDITKDQEFSAAVSPSFVEAYSGPDGQYIPPSMSIKIYDPDGELIYEKSGLEYVSTDYNLRVGQAGTFRMELTNNSPDKAVNAVINVAGYTKTTVRYTEPMGQWLLLISLPIYGLSIWFVITGRKNGRPPAGFADQGPR